MNIELTKNKSLHDDHSLLAVKTSIEKSEQGLHSAKMSAADAKRWKTSLEFEAMFMGQMMKAMRQTIDESEVADKAPGHEIFNDMLDQEYARSNLHSPQKNGALGLLAAKQGKSTGLAAQIYRSLARQEGLVPSPLGPEKLLQQIKPGQFMQGLRNAEAKHISPAVNDAKTKLNEVILDPLIEKASVLFQVSKNLIKSVIQHESGNRPDAISPAGAKGLMQLMDSTASDLKVKNVFDPQENVFAGTKYLKSLLEKFGGDEAKALAGYNAGPAHVEKYGTVPPFPETQRYVKQVLQTKWAWDKQEK